MVASPNAICVPRSACERAHAQCPRAVFVTLRTAQFGVELAQPGIVARMPRGTARAFRLVVLSRTPCGAERLRR